MSAIPGAPLPLDGPPGPPSNPWTTFAVSGGVIAVVLGLLGLLFAGVIGSAALLAASDIAVAVGALLLACALVLAGVGWHLRHPAG